MTALNTVDAALNAFVDPRGNAKIKFGLERIKHALSALGDPQDAIPPALHIAGTNGKGSTAAFCRSIAEAEGFRAHVFSSPHLVRVNERIRIAGRLVSDEDLAAALSEVAQAGPDLTYFEALTAAAYLLFSRTPADVSVIETGAGGLLDSTNVMQAPAATAITAVSRDHEALFGTSDLVEIAKTKAGIFRPGVPAFIAPQDDAPFDALIKAAGAIGAPIKAHGVGWTARADDDGFVFETRDRRVACKQLGLTGAHQVGNAGVAAAVMAHILPALSDGALARGLAAARWPARLQRLRPGPLTTLAKAEMLVDGAHNPAAAAALAQSLKDGAGGRTALVIAMQGNKDLNRIAGHLARAADDVFACPLPASEQEGGRGAAANEIAGAFLAHGRHATCSPDLVGALKLARAAGADRVVICGSLYLAGAALEANDEIPE